MDAIMMKYAVIQAGGKQYRVVEGDIIDVELLKEGEKVVEFDVLFLRDGEEARVGAPLLDVKVRGEVLGSFRGPKVIAYKYKQRKRCYRKVGHRQDYHRVKILSLSGAESATAALAVEKRVPQDVQVAAEQAPVKKATAPKKAVGGAKKVADGAKEVVAKKKPAARKVSEKKPVGDKKVGQKKPVSEKKSGGKKSGT